MTSFSTIHLCCGCCNTAVKRLRMFNVVMIRWPYDKFSGLRMFENFLQATYTTHTYTLVCCGCCNTAVKRLRMFNVVMIRWPYDKFSGLRMFENFLQATYFTLLDSTNIPCTCFLSQ